MPRYLVTGGAGFIGAHLVRALVERGQPVRVLDNFSTGTPANLAHVLGQPVPQPAPGDRVRVGPVEILHGDVRDLEVCRQACAGVEVVFHQAAMRSVPRSVDDPQGAHAHNATGTLHVLLAAAQAGVRRVVYASSSSVYGDDPTLPKREDQSPAPVSPYAASKLAGEAYCRAFARVYGLSTVSLRYFNVFGPLQDPRSQYAAVIPRFITWTLRGEPLEVHGDGLQSRDFTYVDNVVDANLRAADAPDLRGEVFNVGCGERLTLLDVAAAIERAVGREVARVHTPPRPGDVRHTLADITRARARLGYEPRIRFAEGIVRTVAYFAGTVMAQQDAPP
ncbi:MAG: SDR family oxidoreductase [Armatimonadota bacterium]|nr:SDR family oxidoreductase [Armatimonadota bacterium]